MAEIIVIDNQYDQIETRIPISDEIVELANTLTDDSMRPGRYHETFRKIKKMISALYDDMEIPDHDSWSTREDNGVKYIILYKDKNPIPPSKLKTGHIYYNTHMEGLEGADNCGVCNGARCDNCIDVYRDSNGLLYNWPPKELIVDQLKEFNKNHPNVQIKTARQIY